MCTTHRTEKYIDIIKDNDALGYKFIKVLSHWVGSKGISDDECIPFTGTKNVFNRIQRFLFLPRPGYFLFLFYFFT